LSTRRPTAQCRNTTTSIWPEKKPPPIQRQSFLPGPGCLKKRGELDNTPDVVEFAKKVEEATIETIEGGIMTGDMARIAEPKPKSPVSTAEFIDAIASLLHQKL
jgi:isocitrate dehydrogenase